MASGEDEVTISEMDEMKTESDVLVLKRKAKAFVWKYFGLTHGNGHPLCFDLLRCRLYNGRCEGFDYFKCIQPLKSKYLEEYALACQEKKGTKVSTLRFVG